MERTTISIAICDFINASPTICYTQISNEILRRDDLSFKARGILCRMLSNSSKWKSSIKGICALGPEGEHAVTSGIHELEAAGYLLRIRYSDKVSKAVKGSMWVFTHHAFDFNLELIENHLAQKDMIISYNRDKINLKCGNHNEGIKTLTKETLMKENHHQGKHDVSNTILNKDLKESNTNFSKEKLSVTDSREIKSSKELEKEKQLKPFYRLSTWLADDIMERKNIRILPSQIKSWAKQLQLLSTSNGVDYERQKKAMKWYLLNVGGDYIPVIESGTSFREKFIKLESAMNRKPIKPPRPNTVGHLSKVRIDYGKPTIIK